MTHETTSYRRFVLGLILAALLLWLANRLSDVLFPLLFSFLLAYFLNPLVHRLERARLPRALAVTLIVLSFMALSVLFLVVLVPALHEEIQIFLTRLPELVDSTLIRVGPWLEDLTGQEVEHLQEQFAARAGEWVQSAGAQPLGTMASHAFAGTYAFISFLVSLLAIPLFTFYFMLDFDAFIQKPASFVPERHRASFLTLFREIDYALSGFVRGQMLVCIILGLLYGVGYALSGVPLGFLVGITAGVLAFIPYVGAALGFGLSLLLSLLDWQGLSTLIGLSATFIGVQVVDSLFITPRIVGNKIGLPAVLVIIALMVGGELMGFFGVLVAVPAAAVLNILVRHAAQHYLRSDFFTRA